MWESDGIGLPLWLVGGQPDRRMQCASLFSIIFCVIVDCIFCVISCIWGGEFNGSGDDYDDIGVIMGGDVCGAFDDVCVR